MTMPNGSLLDMVLFGRPLRRLRRVARRAEALAQALKSLPNEALLERFRALRATTRAELAESLALAREASRRTLGLTPFPVQLMGAAAILDEMIAEMKTGEGKTLVIALAAAMAAREGRGVHIAVPNPYLAQRDATTMRAFYEFLGFTVGVSLPGMDLAEKQAAYAADITYAVHSELGFDYLRDHLVAHPNERVQRGLHFAIVDEADSILIDEARTPLVISQPAEDDSRLVMLADEAVRPLQPGADVHVETSELNATLTEQGMDRVGAWLTARHVIPQPQALFEPKNLHLMRYITAALRAHFVFRRDQHYLVRDGQVHIIDPATGRVLPGRRWQRGLHQAIEAKEGLPIQPEMETTAEITYQHYFGLYSHMAGLTGTAASAREEFETIYRRPVVVIPTHRPMIRLDLPDLLFVDRAAKFRAIVDDVVEQREKGRPVLIGAASVEESEALSAWLNWAGVPHRVLNARRPEEEAEIIADAGLPGQVTVATAMAGRGTDIMLGGHDDGSSEHAERRQQVIEAGGLHVIGTQRQESRRVDDQLRGRAGRQGDPGSSRFYLSLEDDLLRLYGTQQLDALTMLARRDTTGLGVYSRLIDRAVRAAQRKIESAHFSARHQLSLTDGAIALQRAAVYALRNEILENRIGLEYVEALIESHVHRIVDAYVDPTQPQEKWELVTLKTPLSEAFGVDLPVMRWAMVEGASPADMRTLASTEVRKTYHAARGDVPSDRLTEHERLALLAALDRAWREQLTELDAIREGIFLRGFAQENPAYAFAREARGAFEAFRQAFEDGAVGYLWRLIRPAPSRTASASIATAAASAAPVASASPDTNTPTISDANWPRGPDGKYLIAVRWLRAAHAARLAPCPCGSGRRFKHCHGQLSESHAVGAFACSRQT